MQGRPLDHAKGRERGPKGARVQRVRARWSPFATFRALPRAFQILLRPPWYRCSRRCGGGARLVRLGPKDVRIDFVGERFAEVRYFRVAYRGFIQAGCEFFFRRAVVAELEAFRSPTTLGYRIAWV